MLTEFDLHLFNEGTLHRAYEKLGAHQREVDGQLGVHFAVWAPNADKVSVIGDFNGWNPASHPMRSLGVSGIWEIFVPNVGDGERYKYEIRSREGAHLQKADPYGVFFESDASGAAIVWNLDRYTWRDKAWLDERTRSNGWLDRPLSVYELHLGSWKRVPERGGGPLTYREMAEQIVPYVKDLGYTHIELMPVLEHPFAGSWGYQVTGFFAPTSRFGPPEDFKAFVDECHVNGIAVILDWVPGHFPKDAHGLARFDGTALYEHEDPRQGEHRDWGTLIFNYGRHEVRAFLLSSALFWLEEYHIDGLRVDAVASMLYLDYSREDGDWLPNQYGGRENLEAMEFLRQLNVQTHAHYPGTITVAEESTAWPGVTRPVHLGGLGFTYKWNMGWMHDMLQYASKDPIYRRWSHNDLTFSLLYAFTENFVLPFSHDEVVHGKRAMLDKMPGDIWQKRATLRALYGYMYGHPGKKLMFMGCEFGQWREWGHVESLDWHLLQYAEHRGIQHWVRDLNRTLKEQPALHQVDFDHTGFEWIDCSDFEGSVVSFIRRAHHSSDFVLVAVNFTPVVRHDYVIGVPEAGRYVELLNSDGEIYGGGNLGNSGVIQSEPTPAHGRPHRLSLVLPPLACLILKRE